MIKYVITTFLYGPWSSWYVPIFFVTQFTIWGQWQDYKHACFLLNELRSSTYQPRSMARASLDNKTIIYSEDDNVLASNTLSMRFYSIEYRLIYTKELASGTCKQEFFPF